MKKDQGPTSQLIENANHTDSPPPHHLTAPYSFQNPDLLTQALTHPSYALENTDHEHPHNQRLEFLGDAVLGLVLAEHLYHTLPNEREGILTKSRAALARGSVLARLSRNLGLAPHLRLGRAEELSGGRSKSGAQEDAFEALIGAIYLDGGYAPARDFILRAYGDFQQSLQEALLGDNPKGTLQEWLQARDPNASADYRLVDSIGPDHCKTFHVQVAFFGKVQGQGSGSTKKAAEEEAARNALQSIHKDPPDQLCKK